MNFEAYRTAVEELQKQLYKPDGRLIFLSGRLETLKWISKKIQFDNLFVDAKLLDWLQQEMLDIGNEFENKIKNTRETYETFGG